MAMDVGLLDHYNIMTRRLKETIAFYEDALGLKAGPRPPFLAPGAWLYRGDHPVVHIIDISETEAEPARETGHLDHIAFLSYGFEETKRHLGEKGVPFTVNVVPNTTRCQIFVRDPNNIQLELNYDVKDEGVADRPTGQQFWPGRGA